jgi:hypothetical protein
MQLWWRFFLCWLLHRMRTHWGSCGGGHDKDGNWFDDHDKSDYDCRCGRRFSLRYEWNHEGTMDLVSLRYYGRFSGTGPTGETG